MQQPIVLDTLGRLHAERFRLLDGAGAAPKGYRPVVRYYLNG